LPPSTQCVFVVCTLTLDRKTQIALDYAYRQVDHECHIFWVYAISSGTFSRGYQKISARLKLRIIDDKEEKVLLGVKRWFESDESGKWLLVLDNADNPSEFKGSLGRISKYLPQGSRGTLIVTTRSKTVASRLGCKIIDVPKMKPEEAEYLFGHLHNTIEPTNTNSISELLLVLDYLPLAIAAAAAYMRETGTLPIEYLDILNSTTSNQTGLLMKEFYDIHRGPNDGTESAHNEDDMTESVLSTYYITFRRIHELCPLAANFLKLIAFFDRQAIPEVFLTESGLDGANNILLFNEARGYLLDFSLVSRGANPKNYDIHRLVHLSMKTYALQILDTTINWKGKALDIVSRLFPHGEYEDLVTCTAYLPHALAVLRYGDESEWAAAALLENFGRYVYRKGQYRAAEDNLKRSLELHKKLGGDTLESMILLGRVSNRQGEYIKAQKWFQRALDDCEKNLGKDHPFTLNTVQNMAMIFEEQGMYGKAQEWYKRALNGYEKTLGNNHRSTLKTIHNMASILSAQGEYGKALEWYQRALDGFEKNLGKDHPFTHNIIQNMASILSTQGEYGKALEWYQRALDGFEKNLGKDHPSTLDTVHNMADTFDHLGEYGKALEWYQRALDGRKKALGENHPSTLHTVNSMAKVFYRQGKYNKALEWYQRALDGKKKALGENHPSTLYTARRMAQTKDKLSILTRADTNGQGPISDANNSTQP